ncbi:MAG: hypothetical protein Aureis2KO_12760 [Aureisphaera sp.]
MKKILLPLVLLAALYSCSDDDEGKDTHLLDGTWNLISVVCECAPANFEIGTHVWAINTSNNRINVVNTIDEDLQILENGNYGFSLNDSTIMIQSVTYDYYFEDGKLFLADHPEVDGPLIEFVRNE